MKERSVTIFLAEKITPLIYLIFPILATFSDDITRSKVEYVSIVIVFTITYMMIILVTLSGEIIGFLYCLLYIMRF